MALVDYMSSDEEHVVDEDLPRDGQVNQASREGDEKNVNAKTSNSSNLKRKRDVSSSSSELPPLPSKFHDLYASTVRASTRDDPSLHGGRKRVTPHIEGNWPTHIYIEWYPSTIEFDLVSSLISQVESFKTHDIQTFLSNDLGVPLPLHVSLSRAIGFSKDVKDTFLTSFEQVIKSSGVRPFEMGFSGLAWVPNYEKTRWFLVLRVNTPESNALNKLLHVSNKVVEEFGQPPLYANSRTSVTNGQQVTKGAHPSQHGKPFRGKTQQKKDVFNDMADLSNAFHVSIAWTLLPPDRELIEATERLTADELMKVKQIQIKTEEIKAKIGNAVTNVPLTVGITEGKSLFGL
ncbi:hypothetical protein ACHAQE_002842 [Botrytis cinerea]